MQYWCTVLLLHRPLYVDQSDMKALAHFSLPAFEIHLVQKVEGRFLSVVITNVVSHGHSRSSDHSDDGEARVLFGKSYEMCAAAANYITSIGEGVVVLHHRLMF
jgi:hypothetical protein